jgi:hypothetical protein
MLHQYCAAGGRLHRGKLKLMGAIALEHKANP